MDSKIFTLVMAGVLLAGCSFDNSGVGPVDASPGGDTQGPTDGREPDARPCGATVELALAIDGQATPAVPGTPVELDVLMGDVVELSAAGSCAAVGTLEYQWQITPDEGTADPGLDSEALTFYPTTVDTYTIDFTIGNGMGGEIAVQVEVTAHGWQAIEVAEGNDNVTDIRDLDMGDDELWIAANGGAFSLPLTDVQDEFLALNSKLTSNAVGGDLSAVYYNAADNQVWFGSRQSLSFMWRVNLSEPPVSISSAFGSVDALNTSARVHDIGPAGTSGVAVATDQGLTDAVDSVNFTGDVEPGGDQVQVIASGDGRRWGGAELLYDLDDALAPAIDPFSGGGTDRKIRALVVDEANSELWVGSDDRGIARLNNDTGEVLATFTTADGLPSDKIRHLRVEEADGPHKGDVWAATDKGVARYIRARDAWVAMDADHGLNGFVDIKAIAIDEANGRRAIYAGTTNGVVYIRTP